MTWTDLSGAFGYGTKLTSTQMQNLRDNITALANGDSGAPQIKPPSFDPGSGEVSGTSGSGVENHSVTMNTYTFFPMVFAEEEETSAMYAHSTFIDSGSARFNLRTSVVGSYHIHWDYIPESAEPLFLALRKAGIFQHLYLCGDTYQPIIEEVGSGHTYINSFHPDLLPFSVTESGYLPNENFDLVVIANYPREEITEIRIKEIEDKRRLIAKLNDGDITFDTNTGKLKTANIVTI